MKNLVQMLSLWAMFFFGAGIALGQSFPTQPGQPAKGPGGMDYAHKDVIQSVHGEGARQYWLFEPASPKPEMAPVIVFSHGWICMHPEFFSAWISHLVKKGNIVIFPKYQASPLTPPSRFTPNALASIQNAIEELEKSGHRVKPDRSRFAAVGHSVGGLLTANIAALAESHGLPKMSAIMCVQPGKSQTTKLRLGVPVADWSKIPADTLLLCIAGDKDTVVGDRDARRIFREASMVPQANKALLLQVTDRHGNPPLIADHMVPLGWNFKQGRDLARPNSKPERKMMDVDAMDYALWRLFDAMCEAAFYGQSRENALEGVLQQKSMGNWSDGTAIREMVELAEEENG